MEKRTAQSTGESVSEQSAAAEAGVRTDPDCRGRVRVTLYRECVAERRRSTRR
ncbi:hypothetical protein [Haloarcula laminariae]|uniref:hypothetical protein n=1 Tax=Haloarcula laminariae TaxID=2961577 RepID=UPI002405A73B|nr:hypothetical protein [Halomicroarcula sp. FL173]